eukprot:gene3169-16656_t
MQRATAEPFGRSRRRLYDDGDADDAADATDAVALSIGQSFIQRFSEVRVGMDPDVGAGDGRNLPFEMKFALAFVSPKAG